MAYPVWLIYDRGFWYMIVLLCFGGTDPCKYNDLLFHGPGRNGWKPVPQSSLYHGPRSLHGDLIDKWHQMLGNTTPLYLFQSFYCGIWTALWRVWSCYSLFIYYQVPFVCKAMWQVAQVTAWQTVSIRLCIIPPKKFIIEEKKEDIHINNYNVKQKVIRLAIKVKCPKSLEEAVIAPSWKALGFHFSGSTWAKLGRMHRIFMKTAKRGERNKGSISEKRSYVSHRIEVGRNEAFLRNTEDSNLTRAQGTGREAVRKKAEMLAWGHIMKSLYYPADI